MINGGPETQEFESEQSQDSPSSSPSSSSSSPTPQVLKSPLPKHNASTRGGKRVTPHKRNEIPQTQKYNLLQKLHFNQLYGKARATRVSQEMKFFSRLPGRLAFLIRDAVPQSALIAGHIFLGFTKCGQYLLSYTQTGTESDQFDISFCYHYRLHWWLFQPYSKARKVSEVTLFTNQGVFGNLSISVCQWPHDRSRLVVYGQQVQEEEELGLLGTNQDPGVVSSVHCYLTVTAVPSLASCGACTRVANSYDADDVAAAWDSCVRLSCLQHGVTAHTQFDLVAPYPRFEPKISLKRDNCVVLNTGNFLHAFSLEMEQLRGEGCEESLLSPQQTIRPTLPFNPLSPPMQPISVNVGTSEWSLGSMLGSPGGHSQATFTSDSENTDAESESGYPPVTLRKKVHLAKMEKVANFTSELFGRATKSPRNLFGTPNTKQILSAFPSTSSANAAPDSFEFAVPSERKRRMADAAYELTDDNFDVDVPEKLSTFRKKRLADKKYEFTDDDESGDTFVPLTRQKLKTQESCTSKSRGDVVVCVSERISEDKTEEMYGEESDKCEDEYLAGMLDNASYPELFSPGGCIKKDVNSMSPRFVNSNSQALSPREQIHGQGVGVSGMSPARNDNNSVMSPSRGLEIFCKAKFIRRYIEVDDELISVITDVEEDDLSSSTGYHNALPLEVHGSGYTQLHMITNNKAEKLNLPCVKIEQRSLDLEQFCHETATRLCALADKKFWFCNDYDVEVVDIDPESGDVIAVAVILIQAAILTKSQVGPKCNVSSLSRKQYQAGFKFCWNIDSGQYYLVDSDSLKEIGTFKESSGVWNPARIAALPLKKQFSTPSPMVRVHTNESVIKGISLKAIVDPDNLVALILNDLE